MAIPVPPRGVERRGAQEHRTSLQARPGQCRPARLKEERHDSKVTLALGRRRASALTAIAEPALAQERAVPAGRWSIAPAPTRRTAFRSPTASPTTGRCSTSATAASTASRSQSEECETGYATDKGVECYERLKGKGPTGAGYFSPLSTGITFALTEKVPGDKIPLLTMGYGRSESRNGAVFPWNFIAVGTYWTAADVAIQHIAKELGGIDKLKGKKISLVYHDSPYGKEPIPALEERAKLNGFTFKAIPVTHPGVEQKSQWLAIRQDRPDYVLLWGWGVMNSTADQGGGGGRLSARQDDRRVVVGRRA